MFNLVPRLERNEMARGRKPKELTKKEAIRQLWEIPNLDYKLKGKQKEIKDTIANDTADISAILASRRLGKSYILCCWAVEICLSAKYNIVKYACPEKIMVAENINPLIEKIINDCPPNLKPEWKEARKKWIFPNGSEIQIAGTDKGHIEKLRGGYAQLCICDEAGFMTDLDYVVNSVLAPTIDTTGGRVVLASTPNYKDPLHEFHTSFIYPLESLNKLKRYTIYDSPMLTPERIEKIIARYPGGENNPKFRCEYLCEIAIEKSSMVIPEFTQQIEKKIVREHERPPFYDTYTAGDPGFKDLTGVLFSYYDFKKNILVIEDELVMNGAELTTESLANNIKQKEKKNFVIPVTNEAKEPFLRIMDNNNLILINDLYMLHELSFIATKKDNKEAQINQVRLMISNKQIAINPRCRNLIYHLKNAKWDKHHKAFKRMPDTPDRTLKGGHADLLDALIYLVRNLVKGKNPYPYDYDELKGNDIFRPDGTLKDKKTSLMNKLFNNKN